LISVVIRTRNESKNLEKCIKILRKQTINPEIIIMDTYSNDGIEPVIEKYGCKHIQINPFTFGKALNEGIQHSRGEYICILSAHCFPTENNFLEVLESNFKDRNIAGVYARQIPHEKTNSLEYRNFIYIYRMERIIQHHCYYFNNGASMIRKDIWDKVKFDENVKAQEDMIWARDVQKMEYTIAYDPTACVIHLHEEDIQETIGRYIKEYEVIKEILT